MSEQLISVKVGDNPHPPVVKDLWSFIHHHITVYIEECERHSTNPSLHGFATMMLERSNFYDTTSTF